MMLENCRSATLEGQACNVALYRHFGVPSLGLQLHQIERDNALLKEIVLRSRLDYIAAECCADDKPMNPDDMTRRFEILLTCEATDPPVCLSDLLREVRRRADSGSAVATRFLREFDAACELHGARETAIETIVNCLIAGHPELPKSDFIRQFLGNHVVTRA
jgi:hypothetical protein